MLKIEQIQIGNIASSEIVDFSFSEGQLCGLTKGVVHLNRKLRQEEIDLLRSVSVSIYPNSRLYHATLDTVKKQTSLYFSELHKVNNYVASTVSTYSGASLKSVTEDALKLALNTATISMDSITTTAFTGTISLAGYGQNIAQFALSIYGFSYLRYNTTTNLYHVHCPTDRYFSLGNAINNNVTLSVSVSTVPDAYLSDDFFEADTITVFCPYNEKIILNNANFGSSDIVSVSNHNPLNLFMPYIVSDTSASILTDMLPFLKANYVAVKGRVIKEGIVINVGDTVIFDEYQGVVNKVIRKIDHDVIYFGFPPFPKTIASNKTEDKIFQFGRS